MKLADKESKAPASGARLALMRLSLPAFLIRKNVSILNEANSIAFNKEPSFEILSLRVLV